MKNYFDGNAVNFKENWILSKTIKKFKIFSNWIIDYKIIYCMFEQKKNMYCMLRKICGNIKKIIYTYIISFQIMMS